MPNLTTTSNGRIASFFFAVTVYCVAVPGGASIKAALILLLWMYCVLISPCRIASVVWLLSIPTSAVASAEVAFLHGIPMADVANHSSRILVFFFVIAIGCYMAKSNTFTLTKLDCLILWIGSLSTGLKIAILAAVLLGRASLSAIQKTLGFETVTDDIGFGLQRLQFPSDIAIVFLVACYTGRRKYIDLLFILCVTVDVMLSFSRYLFLAYIVALMIRFFRVRRLDVISTAALVMSVSAALIFSASLAARFGGEGTHISDNIRSEQIRHLSNAIEDNPFFGTGIGSSANSFRRSESIPFSYEVQWYAMAMQLGAIGLGWFLVNLISPWLQFLGSFKRASFFCSVFLLWAAAGFTNPFVVSLGSAFGLCILAICVSRMGMESQTVPHRRDHVVDYNLRNPETAADMC